MEVTPGRAEAWSTSECLRLGEFGQNITCEILDQITVGFLFSGTTDTRGQSTCGHGLG